MGGGLSRPVTSIVMKRCSGKMFRTGFAEMNGWRTSMEDANVIVTKDSWGFFGVFDGHGGKECSRFVADRLTEELERLASPPADDAAVKDMMLRLDQEFLDKGVSSGSTGTFVIVENGRSSWIPLGTKKYHLRVGNVGDSRVLLGDLTSCKIVPGSGTDAGLTVDHKPNHPGEQARIERTGGTVEAKMGIARVNGDLAVSRAFGDGAYKESGGPSAEDHPVIAAPEFTTLECEETNFLMLVCDGISEGNFPNAEVISLAAEKLKEKLDPAEAAAAVCRQAIAAGSKDNLSCMIVLLGGGALDGKPEEFIPGPFEDPADDTFRRTYEAMAEHAGLSLAEAVQQRYDDILAQLGTKPEADDDIAEQELRQELEKFRDGPPKELRPGSKERLDWFDDWLTSAVHGHSFGLDSDVGMPWQPAESEDERKVRVMDAFDELKETVEKAEEDGSFKCNWDEETLALVCGREGVVRRKSGDGTPCIRFDSDLEVCLPSSCFIELTEI